MQSICYSTLFSEEGQTNPNHASPFYKISYNRILISSHLQQMSCKTTSAYSSKSNQTVLLLFTDELKV